MQLHVTSFLVGESIQGLIGTYKDNVGKFIVYIQLILNFIKKFIQNKWNVRRRVHTPDNLPDVGTNVMGTRSNIERMM